MTVFSFFLSVCSFLVMNFSLFVVDGPSMQPTLSSGELFLVRHETVSELENSLQRGNIVVFTLENDPAYFYVKRVIGLPGDRVQIREDGVYLLDEGGEGQLLEEPYLSEQASSVPLTGRYKEYFRQTFSVPQDKIFVMGDNREYSLDSRFFQSPFVPLEQVQGVMVFPLLGVTDTFDDLSHEGRQVQALPQTPSAVVETSLGEAAFTVEVARTNEERMQGLMHRTELAPDRGMVFVFEDERLLSFWMKNTLIPLDIIFIDADMRVVNISRSTPPCEADPCPTYPSAGPAKYVLEIAGGRAAELGIEAGDKVRLLNM